jgi:pimeloyl-ACP methyl ester carboxylesterase
MKGALRTGRRYSCSTGGRMRRAAGAQSRPGFTQKACIRSHRIFEALVQRGFCPTKPLVSVPVWLSRRMRSISPINSELVNSPSSVMTGGPELLIRSQCSFRNESQISQPWLLAFQPRGLFKIPGFNQARRFWYQWFLCVDGGMAKVQNDPLGFARTQWDTWSPGGWFDEAEFSQTAKSFLNPDWVAIALNAYRSRWRDGEAWDSRYDPPQRRLGEVGTISTPTLMIQGMSDFCDAPSESEGLEAHFTAGYQRVLLESVGHLPHREAPVDVTATILRHLGI